MPKSHSFRITFFLTGIALALLLQVGLAHPAFAQEVHRFDIDTTDAAAAIHLFGAQSGVQILASAEVLEGKHLNKFSGEHSTDEGFKQLLAGSGLEHRYVGERAVALVSETSATRSDVDAPQSALQAVDDAEDHASETTENLESAQNSAQGGTATAAPQGQEISRTTGAKSDSSTLAEVLVTGTHIRGLRNRTAPVTVLDKAYIDSTGISTTSDLVARIPQNFALANQSGVNLPGVSSSETQGTSINLRGIGEGTTLILLNGRRLAPGFLGSAVDISSLPLTAIERVEVMTDGASALYGSDAIGGVVNFVLRDDFSGSETRVRFGSADGFDEERYSQVVGGSWGSGNALLSAEYYHRDLLRASDRDWVPPTTLVSSLAPSEENLSVVLAAKQQLTEATSLFAEALYSRRDSYNEGGITLFNESNENENPQISATVGLVRQLSSTWQLETSATRAQNKLEQDRNSDLNIDLGGRTVQFDSDFEIWSGQVKADGSVFSMPGGTARLALGAEWRSEKYESILFNSTGVISAGLTGNPEQTVRSAFAELNVPVVGEPNARPGIRNLDLSLAARFDDYSKFGSSVDPRIGIAWAPIDGLRFRGSYGTSFKAPALINYNLGFNGTLAIYLPDPASPSGVSHQLQLFGANVGSYAAQEATSWSFGAEVSPTSIPDLRIGLNYYDIEYRDQIADLPPGSQVIVNPDAFAGIIIRNPTPEQIAEFVALGNLGSGLTALDPDFNPVDPNDPDFGLGTIEVLLDLRRRNLSVVKTSGVDVSIDRRFNLDASALTLGVDATYIRELLTQVTAASPPVDREGTIFNPPEWKARGSASWNKKGWTVSAFVNYVDSYDDNRFDPALQVDSWLTVDASVMYDFSDSFNTRWLSGLGLSLSVQNILDEDPPKTFVNEFSYDLGFDSTNASPFGRLIAVEVSKAW